MPTQAVACQPAAAAPTRHIVAAPVRSVQLHQGCWRPAPRLLQQGGWRWQVAAAAAPAPQRAKLKRFSVLAAAKLDPAAVLEQLSPAARQQWEECSSAVQQRLGVEPGEADAALCRAFGWASQAYLRRERVEETPKLEQVMGVLNFLGELGMADQAEQVQLVAAFPEVLGLPLELMQKNVEVLQKQWFLKDKTLLRTLLRKPRSLGVLIDCEGNCGGLCTRCWAQM